MDESSGTGLRFRVHCAQDRLGLDRQCIGSAPLTICKAGPWAADSPIELQAWHLQLQTQNAWLHVSGHAPWGKGLARAQGALCTGVHQGAGTCLPAGSCQDTAFTCAVRIMPCC